MRSIRKGYSYLLAIGLAGFLLESCAVKVPPESEELQEKAFANFIIPSTWSESGPRQSDSTKFTENWLAEFKDPKLDALVQEALIYNSDLRISSARIEQANFAVDAANAALKPAFSILGRQTSKLGGDLGGGLNGALFAASWEIDIWGKLRNARSAAEADLIAAESNVSFAKLSIAAKIARAYYLSTETYQQIELTKQMLEVSQEMVEISQKRFEVGIGTEIDLLVAKSNLNNLEDGLRQLQLGYSNQQRSIEVLLGRYPAAEVEVANQLIEINSVIPAGIPLQILERRPDVLAAQQLFNAAFYRVGEAEAARLPKISLTGGIGAISSQVLVLKPDFQNPIRSLGGELIAPIYQGGVLRANVAIRTAQQQEATEVYGKTVLYAISDVENALETVQSVDDREQYLKSALESNARAFELEQKRFEVGKTDMRDVIRQQMDLLSSQMALIRIRSEKITQRINLYLALGGAM
jgi:NodT family efflux transporter outer membrane factor (OMF) lipoprotein